MEPSAYASSSALRQRSQEGVGGDLSDPATLRLAVDARSFRGEVILFAFNLCSIGEALGLIAALRERSFEHFLPFTDGESTCRMMQRIHAANGGLRGTSSPRPP